MASQVLMTISRDEEERARLLRNEKIELDYQSTMVEAKREGKREGAKLRNAEILQLIEQGWTLDQIKEHLKNN